jgi:hypothetical protein
MKRVSEENNNLNTTRIFNLQLIKKIMDTSRILISILNFKILDTSGIINFTLN